MTDAGLLDRAPAGEPPCHDELRDAGRRDRRTGPPGRKAELVPGEEE
jgi:hypothetical protein